MTAAPVSRPGDGLLHPVALGALVLLVVNDQLLKATWPGPVTGILSDVAGLIAAPLALQALWEVVTWTAGRWAGPSRRVLAVAIAIVGVAFALVQVWPLATDAYRIGLGALQWPIAVLAAMLGGSLVPPVRPVVAVTDVQDLLALPALAVSWRVGLRRARSTVD